MGLFNRLFGRPTPAAPVSSPPATRPRSIADAMAKAMDCTRGPSMVGAASQQQRYDASQVGSGSTIRGPDQGATQVGVPEHFGAVGLIRSGSEVPTNCIPITEPQGRKTARGE